MTTVADLGCWWLARARIGKEEAELTICEPASDDASANSLSITGIDAIIALRDCIDEEIKRFEQSLDIEQDIAKGD